MNNKQHTITKAVTLSGVGLHTGVVANLTFLPAPANHGIKFQRVDLPGQPIADADVDYVVDTSRGTTIEHNGARINTVEHVLAALVGLEIDNILIQLDGPEPPIMDGSSIKFVEALRDAEPIEQEAHRKFFELTEEVRFKDLDKGIELAALPLNDYRIAVLVDYNSKFLSSQHANLPWLLCMPIAVLVSMLAGVILGTPTLRLRGDYLAIVTLGFGEIIRIVALNLSVTGGPNGIAGIPNPPTIFGFEFNLMFPEHFFWLVLAMILLTIWMIRRFTVRRGVDADAIGAWWAGEAGSPAGPIASDEGLALLGQCAGNIENPIGMTALPLGVAGPLRVNGLHASGDYWLPLATSEAALVASSQEALRDLETLFEADARDPDGNDDPRHDDGDAGR